MLKAHAGKRRQLIGLVLAIGVAFPFIVFEAGTTVFTAGLQVSIEGNLSPEEREQLNALIEPHVHAGPLMLNPEDFASDLGSLPWVGAVELHRPWFNRVSVKVSHSLAERVSKLERTLENLQRELARMNSAPQRISREQIGMQDRQDEVSNLENLFFAFDLLAREADLLLEELWLGASGDVRLYFEDGTELMLGDRDSVRRFHRFVRIYETALRPQWAKVQGIDARYADAVAVNWAQGKLIASNVSRSSPGETP